MRQISFFSILLLVMMMTACGGERDGDAGDRSSAEAGAIRQADHTQPDAGGPAADTDSAVDNDSAADLPPGGGAAGRSSIAFLQRPELGYRPNPTLKDSLQEKLADIIRWRKTAPRDEPLERMTTELYALFNTLTVTATALDRDGRFRSDIRREITQFNATNMENDDDAGRIMNGMTGVYSMYALLAKMKFYGNEEQQAVIQEINDETAATFKPDIPVVEAAAAIADACYTLTLMIMDDIDSENRFDKAFTQIERQYTHGKQVAKRREDHFINGMFRTFEISQIWALSLNPERRDDVSQMNQGVSDESAEAEKVGTQMAIAVKYLFLISFTIAEDTVELTL